TDFTKMLPIKIGVTILWLAIMITGPLYLRKDVTNMAEDALEMSRNFYGVLRIYDDDPGKNYHRRKMYHGRINHGVQFWQKDRRKEPASYFSKHSGIGIAIRRHPKRLNHEPMKVGIIGLGAGAIATYAKDRDHYTFYEINPEVERLARKYFTFLEDIDGTVDVLQGDGRIVMEHQLEEQGSMQYDVIAIDAFSGDSIPVHLLTKESIDLYFRHLAPDGILAFHISNIYIDLRPVLSAASKNLGIDPLLIIRSKNKSKGIKRSKWVLLTRNSSFIKHPRVIAYLDEWKKSGKEDLLWTDDYSNIVSLLKK
ncbi:MAG: hypothetical protein DRQ62_01310, partial [Gammaproteobacteria bacterium]